MVKRRLTQIIVLILILAMTGCAPTSNIANNMGNTIPPANNSIPDDKTNSADNTNSSPNIPSNSIDNTNPDPNVPPIEYPEVPDDNQNTGDEKISAEEQKQQNSFSIMYYLAIVAEKIRISKDNRLVLEEIYTSLLNDINPSAIDEITQGHHQNLRNIIHSFLNISTKRERLQFIYNQRKAAAVRSAIPNPLAVLSFTQSFDWKKLAVNVVYSAVDAFNNYKNASESADLEFIMSGWDLDDEEVATIQKNRDRAFDYMVDMVQKYNLDGLKTLNEKAIERFAEICSIESVYERTRRLESEESTYSLLGDYWIELANCYFETDKYPECLKCVDRYNELSIDIYRQDYKYVGILPKAIVAAQNTYQGDQYISTIEKYADDIKDNTEKDKDNWAIRYFAAEVYIDLYAKTNNPDYLKAAYEIAYDNVVNLLDNQRKINKTFLGDVEEVVVEEPDYKYLTEKEKKEKQAAYKEDQKRVKKFNKALKEARKTELPSLYEPLIINCNLLFALADKLNISDQEKADIEAVLATKSNGIFISKPINDYYSFSTSISKYSIDMNKSEIIIPAYLLTSDSKITIKITDETVTTIDDCEVAKVERTGNDINTFTAHISSKQLSKYEWTPESRVEIIITFGDYFEKPLSYNFKVASYRKILFITQVEFVPE